MNSKQFVSKYGLIYSQFARKGSKAKAMLIAFFLIITIALYVLLMRYQNFGNNYPLILIFLGVFILWLVVVLSINSIALINFGKSKTLRNYFKNDLLPVLRHEIPEIIDYNFNQKINSKIFINSGFFKEKNYDFEDDDWIICRHGEVNYELCELHVYHFFKSVFDGIFIVFNLNASPKSNDELSNLFKLEITEFEAKYEAKFRLNIQPSFLYVSIEKKGFYFENQTQKSIRKVESDVEFLKAIVLLSNRIIDKTNLR